MYLRIIKIVKVVIMTQWLPSASEKSFLEELEEAGDTMDPVSTNNTDRVVQWLFRYSMWLDLKTCSKTIQLNFQPM